MRRKCCGCYRSSDYDSASQLKIDPELSRELEKVMSGYTQVPSGKRGKISRLAGYLKGAETKV